ncbi:WYL domain-containing protein [Nocardioides fonticola]|uniref:WYL domain-containing protein n=1 Tax=Nocardioides fonticola TaxID=450363 RepID=A0ABP7XUI6_9ACTN
MSERPIARAANSKDQVARLLTLVPYLHARDSVHLEEAARALDVTPRQLLRDLKVLLMCGLPGGYPDDLIDVDLDALEGPDGDGVIRVSNAEYLARPLRLTPTEATAVVVALRALRNGAGEETREIVDRTLAKLDTALAEGSAAALIDPGAPVTDAAQDALGADLERAARDAVQVRLAYFVPARDEVSERTVDPRGVVTSGGQRYLDAWCHTAEAPRLFRLDRIRSAEVTAEPVLTEPEPPRDLADGPFTPASRTRTVALELAREARWVVEYYPVEQAEELGEGRLMVRMRVADDAWLHRLLLRLTPFARVVEPDGFHDAHLRAVQSALHRYDPPLDTVVVD